MALGSPAIGDIKNLDVRAIGSAVANTRQRIEAIEKSIQVLQNTAPGPQTAGNILALQTQLAKLQIQVNQLVAAGAADTQLQQFRADEPIATFDVVYGSSAGGVSVVNPNDPARIYDVLGVATSSAAAGVNLTVRREGALTVSTAVFTPGRPVFAGVDGLTTRPDYTNVAIPMGIALTSTIAWLHPGFPALQYLGVYSDAEEFMPVTFGMIREVYTAITNLLSQPNGFVYLQDGTLITDPAPPPSGTDTSVFLDTFTGTGDVSAHTPDVSPSGSPGWAFGGAISSAALTGVGQVTIPNDGASGNQIFVNPLGVFTPPTGRAYVQFSFTMTDSGDGSMYASLIFGVAESDEVQVIGRRVSGVNQVAVSVNGSESIVVGAAFQGKVLRVEFQNGDQELFIDSVSQGTSAVACTAIISDGTTTPGVFLGDAQAGGTVAPTQTALVSELAFGPA